MSPTSDENPLVSLTSNDVLNNIIYGDSQSISFDAVLGIPEIISNGGEPSATVTISENSTFVTDIQVNVGSDVFYAINDGADADLFTIDPVTGILSFKGAPDYEAPIDADGNNVYFVNVIAFNEAGGDSQFLAVVVEDVDELEIPSIISNGGGDTAVISLDEGETQVTDVNVSGASDVIYQINAGADADLFTIDAQTGELTFNTPPDYEAPTDADGNNVYFVNVIAFNGEGGDSQFLSVVVNNIEELEIPTITSNGGGSTATITLSEGETQVTDVNVSGATNVTYNINAGADADLFEIDAETGELTFKAAPDYEAPADADNDNVYEINVVAFNGDGGDSQFISVEVQDVDELEIISNGGQSTAVVRVDENSTFVTDVDVSLGGNVFYDINNGADADLFTINHETGELSFKTEPDYENPTDANGNNVYDVNVIAYSQEGGDSQFLSVIVENIQDTEAPVITSNGGGSTAVINLNEGVTQVTDVSVSGASDVIYAINAGADADKFTIDRQTGALSFKTAPDYENPGDTDGNNVYFANVIAYNQYGGDSQFVSVVVKDVPDTTVPDIVSDGGDSTTVIYLDEGSTHVTDVNASGDDNVIYAINNGADADKFIIDPQTGGLSFKTAPDYENPGDADGNNVYFANVIAYNQYGGDSQFISVRVTDVKETAPPPNITSNGGGDIAALSLTEGENQVTQVVAMSAAPGNALTFSLDGGADADLFTINSNTGVLFFQNEPDFESPTDTDGDNLYEVTVKVTDTLGQSDTQALTIDVTNVASVYLLAGQSNMAGQADSSGLPPDLTAPFPGASIWQYISQSFEPLRPGFNGFTAGTGDEFGPEVTFGREIAERSDEEIYLVKYARGATSLAVDWDPQAANRDYDELISRVEDALDHLEDMGIDYSVEGVAWMQGESDTYNDDYAAAYEANLIELIADIRSRYGSDVEFALGRVNDLLPTSPANRATVRSAQETVAGLSSLNHLVSTDGLALNDDGVHFNPQGQIALGAAFADAFNV